MRYPPATTSALLRHKFLVHGVGGRNNAFLDISTIDTIVVALNLA